jgi:hypothetical protein
VPVKKGRPGRPETTNPSKVENYKHVPCRTSAIIDYPSQKPKVDIGPDHPHTWPVGCFKSVHDRGSATVTDEAAEQAIVFERKQG